MLKSITIGAIHYAVKTVHNLYGKGTDGKNEWLWGRIKTGPAVIEIDDEAGVEYLPVLLLHEAFHGILDQAGHDDHPESVIRALSYGVVALLRANPQLAEMVVRPNVTMTITDTTPNVWSNIEAVRRKLYDIHDLEHGDNGDAVAD